MDDTQRMQEWHERYDRMWAEDYEIELDATLARYREAHDDYLTDIASEYDYRDAGAPSRLARAITREIMEDAGY